MASSFASPKQQLFSIPYNFVLYMAENPSTPEILDKLYQTSKFFFSKNPIMKICYLDCHPKNQQNYRAKVWPVSYLVIKHKIYYVNIFKFSPSKLHIWNCILTQKEFDLLIAENRVIFFRFYKSKIIDANVDKVLEKLPKVTDFWYDNEEEIYYAEILQCQRILKFDSCGFTISKASSTFSPATFVRFMQQYGHAESVFKLHFSTDLASLHTEFFEELKNWKEDDEAVFNVNIYGDCIDIRFPRQ